MAKQPVRIFEGSAQPHQPFWHWRDVAEGEEPELEFYGFISEYSWFEDDITPKMFKDDLYKIGNGGPIKVRIHSYGGDVWAASVIRSTIVDYPGKVTAQIDGLCASAATIVALAGDQVLMQESGYFMIHDPSTITWGNIEEIKRALDSLKTCKDGILDGYETKTGLSRDKLSKMMTDETWLTAREAKTFGFVDEVITAPGAKAVQPGSQAVLVNALRNYVNVPAALLAADPWGPPPSKPVNEQAADVLRAEAKKLCLTKGVL